MSSQTPESANGLRKALNSVVKSERLQNLSLLLSHYPEETKSEKKPEWYDKILHVLSDKKLQEFYKKACERRLKDLTGKKDVNEIVTIRLSGVMAHGLGKASSLETGITLNDLYGLPMIPGSSLKGLAASWCDQQWGKGDSCYKENGAIFNALFGTTEESGLVTFHDAWLVPEQVQGCVVQDVMTPHHGDYYGQKGEEPPTDCDSPVPVPFLAVKGNFHLVVDCYEPDPTQKRAWLELVYTMLDEALKNWGIGGKTRAGYGRGSVLRPTIVAPSPLKGLKIFKDDCISLNYSKYEEKHKKHKWVYQEEGRSIPVGFEGSSAPAGQKGDSRPARAVEVNANGHLIVRIDDQQQ